MHSKQQQQHHFQMRYKIFPVFSFSFSFCQIEIQKRQNHHERRKLFGQNQKKKKNLTFSKKRKNHIFLFSVPPQATKRIFLFAHLKCMTEVEKKEKESFSLSPTFIFNKWILLRYCETSLNQDFK